MPQFSIIIPVFNKEKFIEDTLKSVLQQSFTDYEILIINDGSTDASEAKILAFNDARIQYFRKENEGVSEARNYGIENAKSEYITFLDADDYWYPNFLEEMLLNIGKFPEQKVFAGAIEIENPKNVIPSSYSIPKSAESIVVNYFEASYLEGVIFTSCAAFHKSVFETIGNFDPKIKSGQDTDLWIRIGLVYPVVFSFKILTRYIYDPNSLSKKSDLLHQKLDFSKFTEAEKSNPALKKFLDLNRYSLAIKSKLINDKTNFYKFTSDINFSNLSLKKRILLRLPGFALHFLLQVNLLFVQLGWSKSVFK
jgi:glycosyltransferase involved in cell wall biosynthesis